jgi:DsbC/DsbD-like thiol-disulfide interchange protein
MRALALIAFAALVLPAHAAETPWQEIAPDVRLRLISSDILAPDGTTTVGLELDMPQGTKTYWRVPGEGGLPTQLDIAGSTGVTGHQFVWPYPQIEQVSGLTDFVYRGPTVLPIRLSLSGERADLKASVVMGVCSDICVPAMASFSLPLDLVRPDRGQGLRLNQALALAPTPWSAAASPFGPVSWAADMSGVTVPLLDPAIDPLSLIADASASGQLFGAPQKSPDGSSVFLPLLGAAGDASSQGIPVELTFRTAMGAFSLSTVVDAGSTASTQ